MNNDSSHELSNIGLILWRPLLFSSALIVAFIVGSFTFLTGALRVYGSMIWPLVSIATAFFTILVAGTQYYIYRRYLSQLEKGYRRHYQTQLHLLKQKIKSQAYRDELTRLPNRTRLLSNIRKCVEQCSTTGNGFTLYLIQMYGYEHAVNQHGYAAGDSLLREFSQKLKHLFGRPAFSVARNGQTEFALLANGSHDDKQVLKFAHSLINHFSKSASVSDSGSVIELSVGIAKFPEHGTDETSLYSNCTQALQRAKEKGKGAVTLYLHSMRVHSTRLRLLEEKLHAALKPGAQSRLCLF